MIDDTINTIVANLDPSRAHHAIRPVRAPVGEGEGGGTVTYLAIEDAARVLGLSGVEALLSVLLPEQKRVIGGRTYIDGPGLLRGLARLVSIPRARIRFGGKRRLGDTPNPDLENETATLFVAMDPSNRRIEQVYESLETMVEEGHFSAVEEARAVVDRDLSGVGRYMRWQRCPRTLREDFLSCGGNLPLRPHAPRPWRRVLRFTDMDSSPRQFRSIKAAAASVGGDCAGLKDAIARAVPWRGSTWCYAQK